MKYVILTHSNPQPWGHPTADFLPAAQALPEEVRTRLTKDFEEVPTEMQANGELIGGEALGDPPPRRCTAGTIGHRSPSTGPTPRRRSTQPGSS